MFQTSSIAEYQMKALGGYSETNDSASAGWDAWKAAVPRGVKVIGVSVCLNVYWLKDFAKIMLTNDKAPIRKMSVSLALVAV